MIAMIDPDDRWQLKGFQIFDAQDRLIQFIDHQEDLSNKVPEYILGKIPDAPPVQFVDCDFDGYPDAMMREDLSPRFASFEIWLWNASQHRFVHAKELSDLNINGVDLKTGYLFSSGSEGHGHSGVSAYAYTPTGKIFHVYSDVINWSRGTETRTYYSVEGKETKTITSPAPDR